jgi:hypothetical protein
MLKVSLPEAAASMPVVFGPSEKGRSFLYIGASGIIYLVDYQGNVFFDEEISTNLPLIIWKNPAAGTFSLVTVKGNSVFLCPLP